ncbi:hypothetical protein [Pseudarthrobacter sp. NS4]|uniref:hypothetical protein n=1 Tax=Pseudarthrobacter sp. NS4 TaxID=2973976 RepID=UPI0021610FAD|nr:hypothetical protein [Pseudarthrobacter sp. NS4]
MNSDGTGGPEQLDEAAEQRRGAAQRFRETELPLVKLWTYYYGIGGDIDEVSLDAYLNEALDLPAAQVGLITTAMMEMTEGDTQ